MASLPIIFDMFCATGRTLALEFEATIFVYELNLLDFIDQPDCSSPAY